MYEDFWRGDARFRYSARPSDEPFFRLYTSPSDLDAFGFLMGSFSRQRGLNGFAATIEHYPRPGQMPEIETLYAHHFVLDGDFGPLVNGDGDEESSNVSASDSSEDDSSSGNSSSGDSMSADSSTSDEDD